MKSSLSRAFLAVLSLGTGILVAQTPCTCTMLVSVLDRTTNQPVDRLTASDFRARYKGKDLTILSIAPPPAARRFVFVVDRSGSMTSREYENLPRRRYPDVLTRQVLEDALPAIPTTSTVAFLAFAGKESQRTPFLEPSEALRKLPEMLAWKPTRADHRTPLWANVDSALRMLSPPGRGDVIIVISDGGDNESKTNESALQIELLKAGVPVFTFAISTGVLTPEEESGASDLFSLVKATGGVGTTFGSFGQRPDPDVAVSMLPRKVIAQLEHQYELTVAAPLLPKPEKWELALPPGSQKSARLLYPHYLAPCQPPAAGK